MRFLRGTASVTLLLLFVMPGLATAKPLLVWYTYDSMAPMHRILSRQAVGSHIYFADPETGLLSAWVIDPPLDQRRPKVVGGTLGEGDGRHVQSAFGNNPRLIPPNPDVVKVINGLVDFYTAPPVGWHKHVALGTLPAGQSGELPDSAWDLTTGANVGNFNDYWNSNPDLFWDAANLHVLVQIGATLTLLDQDGVGRYTFPDGSHVDIRYNTETGQLEADRSTMRDSEGNPIPYMDSNGAHGVVGTKEYNPMSPNPNLDNYLDWLSGYGISVGPPPGPPLYTGTGSLGCVQFGDSQVSCYVTRTRK